VHLLVDQVILRNAQCNNKDTHTVFRYPQSSTEVKKERTSTSASKNASRSVRMNVQ